MRHPSEDELAEYKREDREDKMRARLQRRAHPVGSHSLEPPDPCEECGGSGFSELAATPWGVVGVTGCIACLGTGVQP